MGISCPECDSRNIGDYSEVSSSKKGFCLDCGRVFNPMYTDYEDTYEFWHPGYCGRCKQLLKEKED